MKTVGEMVAKIPEHITPETERVEELPQSKVSVLTHSINKRSEFLLHARYRFVSCAIPSSESTPPANGRIFHSLPSRHTQGFYATEKI